MARNKRQRFNPILTTDRRSSRRERPSFHRRVGRPRESGCPGRGVGEHRERRGDRLFAPHDRESDLNWRLEAADGDCEPAIRFDSGWTRQCCCHHLYRLQYLYADVALDYCGRVRQYGGACAFLRSAACREMCHHRLRCCLHRVGHRRRRHRHRLHPRCLLRHRRRRPHRRHRQRRRRRPTGHASARVSASTSPTPICCTATWVAQGQTWAHQSRSDT